MSERLADAWARLIARRQPQTEAVAVSETALATAPVVWLLGKVQSGKTSIVKAITACSDAEVGMGFKACTRTARVFDFPEAAPLIRFLDTRGLGEAGYDPEQDIAVSESKAHLLLVVMRALDQQQDAVLNVVTRVRKRHPDWPIVVAQTSLHEAYPHGSGHRLPYPFVDAKQVVPGVPEDLVRSLARQRTLFDRMPGGGKIMFVPIDFTLPEDGLSPQHYGFDALMAAIGEAAPAGLAATLREIRASGSDRIARSAHPSILGHAMVAATADVVPVAGALAVPGVQAKMLYSLGVLYNVQWDRRTLTEFAACLGASVVARLLAVFGLHQLVKLVPIYGQTAGSAASAATSFATTYALGKAAGFFLSRRKLGAHDPAGVAAAYRAALEEAFRFAKERDLGRTTIGGQGAQP